ncbi:MAG: hypothetical protein JO087_02095 [Actinobacteria bacterium]|nr:hypothetical protein [Actinomycetota bacterium]
MNRSTLARRYAPLALALAVQLLIIVAAPSTAGRGGTALAAGDGTTGVVGGGGGTSAAGGSGTDLTAGGTGTASGGATGVAGGSGTSGVAGGRGSAALPPGASTSGDTSHCKNGRQYDPAIAWWAPPCVPGTPGGSFASNGGATYQGVTKDTITILDYVTDYGAEVNAILQAEGTLVTYSQAQNFDKAMEAFINKYYVLYGRKVHIVTYQGQCQSVPPAYSCLIPEMDKIVDSYHPYMVFWNTTLCSACYAELARKKTIGVGGDGFSDEFSNANAPYFYSTGESSTRVETAFAQWWCNQMSSVNVPARKVKYAETGNPAQNFNGQARRLGVISTNDPDNEDTVKKILDPALQKYCGDHIWHTYFYDQNINTAAQQVQAGISAMDTPQNPATTVLCLCDAVAPAFLFEGEQQNNYYPENVIASDQNMDYDTTGQSYEDSGGQPSLGCPTPAKGCEYDLAFGLSTEGPHEPQANNEGLRVFKAGGGTDLQGITAVEATALARHYSMMANLIENTGPNLTPQNMQAQAPKMGTVGGGATGLPLLGFLPNDWQWTQDTRIVYWDKHRASSYNGKPGTYVQIQGNRFNLGQYPVLPDGPVIPGGRTP